MRRLRESSSPPTDSLPGYDTKQPSVSERDSADNCNQYSIMPHHLSLPVDNTLHMLTYHHCLRLHCCTSQRPEPVRSPTATHPQRRLDDHIGYSHTRAHRCLGCASTGQCPLLYHGDERVDSRRGTPLPRYVYIADVSSALTSENSHSQRRIVVL